MEKEHQIFRKHQNKELKLQKFFSKFKRFRDVDPRPLIRPFNQKKYLKGVFNWFKFFAYETLYSFYSLFKGDSCKLNKPVFIVGLPHSGTSIFMKLVALHPDLTNASELNTYWHTHNYLDIKTIDHFKDESNCTPKAKNRLTKRLCFEKLIKGNKKRLLNKNPNNIVTVEYIKACFPDAYIIHIIRDGRSVVNSLVNSMPEIEKFDRYKSPEERVNPFPGVKPKNWKDLLDKNPLMQHAKQWQACIKHLRNRKEKLLPEYLEITYEDLCENTREIISKVWSFADLVINKEIINTLPEQLNSMNYKYKKFISEKDIEEITLLLKAELTELGYIR